MSLGIRKKRKEYDLNDRLIEIDIIPRGEIYSLPNSLCIEYNSDNLMSTIYDLDAKHAVVLTYNSNKYLTKMEEVFGSLLYKKIFQTTFYQ